MRLIKVNTIILIYCCLACHVAGLYKLYESLSIKSVPCRVMRSNCVPNDSYFTTRYDCMIEFNIKPNYYNHNTEHKTTNVKYALPVVEDTECYILDNGYVLDNEVNIRKYISLYLGLVVSTIMFLYNYHKVPF